MILIVDVKEEDFFIMEREKFNSRLGFILISAGCAIGIGNVWRFPYVAGSNGGGFFVLFYLLFLAVFGIPVLLTELAIGRASGKSIVSAYQKLEKPGQKWHFHGVVGLIGNLLLMMYYTTVAGWMIGYFMQYVTGQMESGTDSVVRFDEVLANPGKMMLWMFLIVMIGSLVCSLGLQNGVERITKWMMLALLALIVILAVHSMTLPGAKEGLQYYLIPDVGRVREAGLWNVIVAAMNQSFFTLSIGIGSMMIFGSYMDRERTLLSEGIQITLLDTFVAVMAGLIIFPACFSFGVSPDSGPSLIFVTLPRVFEAMAGGRIWGTLFFLFMTFAALSTVIAIFENILACLMDGLSWSRKKASIVNFIVILLTSIPCVLGFNRLSGFSPLGEGTTILDLEDFLVSSILLPAGSLIVLLFCVSRYGWGFEKFREETNAGKGIKLPGWCGFYMKWILPILIILFALQGIF